MSERYDTEKDYARIAWVLAALMVGGLGGYIIALQTITPAPSATSSQAAAPPAAPIVDESALRAYRDILARDPKNVDAAVAAGNLLYDAQRYGEAIPFYQAAFAARPTDVNVSTDLGTALWYSGRADEALAQYERSLAIDPAHAHTLFNVGVVRADGKQDYLGAAAAWEKLLAANPTYPKAADVHRLIGDARRKVASATR